MIGLDTLAQLLFKSSAERVGVTGDWIDWLLTLAQLPTFWAGASALALTFPVWMLILRNARLNLAFPATALTFVGVIAGSRWLFSEPIEWIQYCGIVLIVVGVGLMGTPRD
jgi:drug/metabolite transporter (DMT)-like permease